MSEDFAGVLTGCFVLCLAGDQRVYHRHVVPVGVVQVLGLPGHGEGVGHVPTVQALPGGGVLQDD